MGLIRYDVYSSIFKPPTPPASRAASPSQCLLLSPIHPGSAPAWLVPLADPGHTPSRPAGSIQSFPFRARAQGAPWSGPHPNMSGEDKCTLLAPNVSQSGLLQPDVRRSAQRAPSRVWHAPAGSRCMSAAGRASAAGSGASSKPAGWLREPPHRSVPYSPPFQWTWRSGSSESSSSFGK